MLQGLTEGLFKNDNQSLRKLKKIILKPLWSTTTSLSVKCCILKKSKDNPQMAMTYRCLKNSGYFSENKNCNIYRV